MSTLSNFPLGHALEYWSRRLSGHDQRFRFLCTKFLEVLAYQSIRPLGKRFNSKRPRVPPDPLNVEPHIAKNDVTEAAVPAVVVPVLLRCHRELGLLKRLIARLGDQSWAAKVILVDDCSPEPLPDMAGVEVVQGAARRGPAAARNLGVNVALAAGAQVVFFTDADCLPDKTWVEAGMRHLLSNPFSHLVSGNTRALDASWLGQYHEINGTLNGRAFQDSSVLLYGPTCNLAASAYLLRRIHFEESFRQAACEDIHFCFQAYHRGFLAQHVQAMGVAHDFQYEEVGLLAALRRFVGLFRKYARSEPLLLEHLPDYYDYFNQTVEIPGNHVGRHAR